MLTELNFTDARKSFSSLYDDIFNSFKPMIIKRKKTEEIVALRVDLQKMLLANFSLKPETINEDDNSITLALDQLDMYVNSDNLEKAKTELVKDLKYYAQDYIDRSQLFLHSPNRRVHFPYILRILLCNSDDEVLDLLEI